MIDVETELGKAVKHFWKTRTHQKKRQGTETGRKDAGNRGAVTGGKHAIDFWTAYKKGVFKPSQKPWLGYLFMLEEDEKSVRPTQRIGLKPFSVDEAFQELSYAKRYALVCERLVREMLYDAACFFTSSAKTGIRGAYDQPNEELSIRNFAISLHARAAAFAGLR